MKAFLKNYNQSPRKVRLVTGLVSGRKVEEAEKILIFTKKRAAKCLNKLIKSAVTNAENTGKNKSNLYIESAYVDEGIKLRRFRPKHRGVALPYKKRASRITINLVEKAPKEKKEKKTKIKK